MKKILKYTLLCGTIAATSCDDYLEQAVDQRTQLNSVEKVSELLVTAYPQADYITFMEAMSDNAGDKGNGEVEKTEINEGPYFYRDVAEKQQGSPDNYWNACYAAIAAANQALDAISKASNPTEYSAQKGEALLARAYAHHMLVSLFSKIYDPTTAASDPGIPYVTTPERIVLGQYERKTVAYVYEQIEKDITEGLPLINNAAYRVPKYHFTTSAAHAFATRFYLFKRDYQKVIEHANQVVPGGITTANFRPWTTFYRTATYFEIVADFTKATLGSNLLLADATSWWGRSFASYRFGLTYNIQNEVLSGNNPVLKPLAYRTFGASQESANVPKFQEHFVRSGINANTGLGHVMVPLFTVEEVVFNRAEAYLQLGDNTNSLKDLNLFLSARITDYNPSTDNLTVAKASAFYGQSNPGVALLVTLLQLKRGEFMHEGLRWFDILRYKIPVLHQTVDGQQIELGPEDPRRVLQLPAEVKLAGIELNPR
jgi:hypothetical protein